MSKFNMIQSPSTRYIPNWKEGKEKLVSRLAEVLKECEQLNNMSVHKSIIS
jgi:hypothetical protein